MCKHDENRYYIARGADSAEAIRNTVDQQVPAHHKAYTQPGEVKHLGSDRHLVTVTVLGDDSRNDAGTLRDHLTMMVAGYPQATVTHRTVAGRIATLILEADTDDAPTLDDTIDLVLEQAQIDAACFDEVAAILDNAATEVDA
jgi:hypothetical protein